MLSAKFLLHIDHCVKLQQREREIENVLNKSCDGYTGRWWWCPLWCQHKSPCLDTGHGYRDVCWPAGLRLHMDLVTVSV